MAATFLIGAHGQIGQQLVPKLINKGITVHAGLRNLNQITDFSENNSLIPELFDLTVLPETMAKQFKAANVDLIIFSAGSGGNTGDDATLIIDLDGAVKAMEAAQLAGIKRFILVSSAASNDRSAWDQTGIKPYMIAKYYADKLLIQSHLEYTILRPGALQNKPGTGHIALVTDGQTNLGHLMISREDVAEVIATIIDMPTTYRQVYTLGSGSQVITTAF